MPKVAIYPYREIQRWRMGLWGVQDLQSSVHILYFSKEIWSIDDRKYQHNWY